MKLGWVTGSQSTYSVLVQSNLLCPTRLSPFLPNSYNSYLYIEKTKVARAKLPSLAFYMFIMLIMEASHAVGVGTLRYRGIMVRAKRKLYLLELSNISVWFQLDD